ncbi:unnamed protein product [Leptosia nina]|uniref:Glucose-methanol-choline oxidoreductase N-terminal domain-containing protein n=1 Tax=Leptosia nina TaxID=320188 RepID=A0AAV1IZ48_9NEOP
MYTSTTDIVSGICPPAFAGTSGNLFLNAISTVILTHCSIFDDYRWPPDNSNIILEKETEISYDFLIIGAGSAGSLVAGEMSNSNIGSVLLIEAGDDPGIDSEIPAFLFLNQNSDIDWYYKTSRSKDSCLGFINESCIWSKGRGMGGSSSINAMIYVRGHPKDYDYWESLGNSRWGYKDLLKYFEKQEYLFNFSNVAPKEFHNPWYDIIDSAWQELGLKSHKYEGDESLIGTRKVKLTTRNGKRLNTAKIFLKDSSETLDIMKNTFVSKILFKNGNAVGVEMKHKNGKKKIIKAKKEIILSAGSIATPQILMQSGVGPKDYIERMGIESIINLDVGHNLQDHIFFPLFLKTNQNATLSMEVINILLVQYMLTRSGPFSTIGITDFTAFIDSSHLTDKPDIQYHHTYFTKNDTFTLKPYLEGLRYKREIIHAIQELNNEHDLIGIYPTLLYPKSRGRILLSKTEKQPIIETNYLQHPDDMDTLLKAINFVHRLEATKAFKSLAMEILHLRIPTCSASFNTENYWKCYIRHMATTIYHPVGSAKMGPKGDKTSVVSDQLLVHGTSNLRVVDASIMPSLPGGNTMAPTLVIAQKGVDIILNKYKNRNEL